MCAGNNYEKLLKGEIGINLIQTHSAMSLAVMDEWVKYVFQTAAILLGVDANSDGEISAVFADIQAFCGARTHNIWGSDRNEDTPCVSLRYDVVRWMRSEASVPLSQYRLSSPVMCQFGFTEAKKEEMAGFDPALRHHDDWNRKDHDTNGPQPDLARTPGIFRG